MGWQHIYLVPVYTGMEEIELDLENDLPFCNLSRKFPEVEFYRWCNSAVDYLEFYGDFRYLEKLMKFMPEVESALGTEVIYSSPGKNRLSLMISCRCSTSNSTIRMVESRNLMWKAPVYYSRGHERLSLLSPVPKNMDELYADFKGLGKFTITKKLSIAPDLIRDIYTVSLSQLFSTLTNKQMRYLVSAFYQGYFDIPRKTKIDEMASNSSLSYSSLQEHLEKGISKIMKGLEPYLSLNLHLRETQKDLKVREKNNN